MRVHSCLISRLDHGSWLMFPSTRLTRIVGRRLTLDGLLSFCFLSDTITSLFFFSSPPLPLGLGCFIHRIFFFSSVMFSSFLGEAMMERERMTERVMVCLTDGWMNGWMDVKLVLLIIGHLSAHVDDTVVWNCTLSHHVS